MTKNNQRRTIYSAIALFCFTSVALAIYLQYYYFVLPCPLCIFQRIGLITCGILALGACFFPNYVRFWGALITVSALAGAGVSIRHIQIQQSLAGPEVESCGAGLSYMLDNDSLPQVIMSVLAGHGDCTIIDWQWGFITLPMLALSGYFLITGLAMYAYMRREIA